MNIDIAQDGTKATLVLSGKLTVATSPQLKTAIEGLPGTTTDFVIDIADLDYISSAGLRVLVGTQKAATARGGSLTLLSPKDDVMEVFEMTGFTSIFTIEP